MKTIIAGTRHATSINVSVAISKCPFECQITEVVSGKNKVEVKDSKGEVIRITGADYWGEQWAKWVGEIPVAEFPADWNNLELPGPTRYRDGRPFKPSAGPIRNQQMADYADALILVWDGKSKGSADMLKKAKAKGLRVFVWDYVKGCEVAA